MPRPDKERITPRQATGPVSHPQPVQVVARPVDTTVMPAVDHEMAGLMQGLATLNPALERYMQTKDTVDESAGYAARGLGKERDRTQSDSWQRGYLHMDGTVKGLADRATVATKYDTQFSKDNSTPEQLEGFISATMGELTKGMTDQSFLAGYHKALLPALEKTRESYLAYHHNKAVETRDTNAMTLLESGVRERAGKGKPVDDAFIDQAKAMLGGTGVSGTRFNELLFGAVKRFGDEGNDKIYEMFKRPRPDGTPGMYFIPAWKEKIDAAQIHAQNVFITQRDKAEVLAKKQREEMQDTALYDVFSLLYSGDTKAARTAFDGLLVKGIFTRASDLVKWESQFATTTKKEERADQMDTQNALLTAIYKGGTRPALIIDADLTPKQKTFLLGEQRKVAHENRTLAQQGERDGKAIYRDPVFKSSEDFIKGQLASAASPMDVMGVGSAFDRQQRASAVLEFTQRAAEVKTPVELHAIREDIVTRYQKRRAEWGDKQKAQIMAGRTRYASPEDAAKAYKAGGMTLDEANAWADFFESKRKVTK